MVPLQTMLPPIHRALSKKIKYWNIFLANYIIKNYLYFWQYKFANNYFTLFCINGLHTPSERTGPQHTPPPTGLRRHIFLASSLSKTDEFSMRSDICSTAKGRMVSTLMATSIIWCASFPPWAPPSIFKQNSDQSTGVYIF